MFWGVHDQLTIDSPHTMSLMFGELFVSGYHEGKNNMALSDLQSVIQKDSSNVKAHYYIGKLLAKGTENEYS